MSLRDLAALHSAIDSDPPLRSLREKVRERMARLERPDPGHDLAHFLRVALWTARIGEEEGALDRREAIAAALLHDIVPIEKNSPLRKEASRLCAEEAARLLPGFGFTPEAVARIADAIRCHSFSRGERPVTPLARALQDADRLEALGSLGILRLVSTGARMGSDYFHPTDPWAKARQLDDRRFSVDHFFAKLFLLPGTMTTGVGRVEAEKRLRIMREFLSCLAEELGEPCPDLSI